MSEITDKRLQWAKLLTATTEEELNSIQAASNNPAIDQAVLTVKTLSADKQMRLEADTRMKELRDKLNYHETGFAEGMEKGLEKGLKEGMEIGAAKERERSEAKIAKVRDSLKALGYNDDAIKAIFDGNA